MKQQGPFADATIETRNVDFSLSRFSDSEARWEAIQLPDLRRVRNGDQNMQRRSDTQPKRYLSFKFSDGWTLHNIDKITRRGAIRIHRDTLRSLRRKLPTTLSVKSAW